MQPKSSGICSSRVRITTCRMLGQVLPLADGARGALQQVHALQLCIQPEFGQLAVRDVLQRADAGAMTLPSCRTGAADACAPTCVRRCALISSSSRSYGKPSDMRFLQGHFQALPRFAGEVLHARFLGEPGGCVHAMDAGHLSGPAAHSCRRVEVPAAHLGKAGRSPPAVLRGIAAVRNCARVRCVRSCTRSSSCRFDGGAAPAWPCGGQETARSSASASSNEAGGHRQHGLRRPANIGRRFSLRDLRSDDQVGIVHQQLPGNGAGEIGRHAGAAM